MAVRSKPAEELSLPTLLRAARNTYATAVREPLRTAGFDDLPRNGVFVIGAISRTGAPLAQIIRWLGVSKQAAGQLIDVLVLRGYLERVVDEDDRRRLRLGLTERGRAVAVLARTAVERVDEQLLREVGAAAVARTRATLQALIALSCEPAAPIEPDRPRQSLHPPLSRRGSSR
jgi:DNA-binding MarR family transcriptional regulator